MKSGNLNVVEKLFRNWETVHPYNAAQVVTITGQPRADQVQRAWNAAIEALRLTPDCFNHPELHTQSNRTSRFSSDPCSATLQQPLVSMQEHLRNELNHRFSDDPAESPFRPFLLSDGATSSIGMTYRHCVADSVSIRLLLREWISRVTDDPLRRTSPPKRSADGYWKLFAAKNGSLRLDQTLSAFLRGHHRLRSAQKPATSGETDCQTRVMLGKAPPGLMSELRDRCRARETRTSDVMLTALLEAARRHVPLQRRPNRRDVAVGCIVNLRPYAVRNLADTFGLYLGFTSVVGSPRDFLSQSGLLQTVRRQTAMQRRHGIAPACTVWVHAGLALEKFMPRERLYHFYRKSMPLAAGLSSVRIGPEDSLGPGVLDYLRVSPTGPIAPAVLSTTEMNGQLSLALTYRPAVIADDSARALIEDFTQRLRLS